MHIGAPEQKWAYNRCQKTEAATQKSQFLKFGLTQRYEMLHNVA